MEINKIIFITYALVCVFNVNTISQSKYYELVSEAHGYYYTADYDKSLAIFTSAFTTGKGKPRDLIIASYAAAMSNNNENALDFLKQFFDQRSDVYLDIESIISVLAYKNIRSTSQFKNIVDYAHKNNTRIEPKLNNKLRLALEKLYELDQKTRDMKIMDSLVAKHGFPSEPVTQYFNKMNALDKKNLSRFKQLVPVGTWPGIGEVGVKANLAAWLIIQHSSTATQKQYLEAIKKSAEVGESNWGQVAGTIDRIMEEEVGIQLYGTQFGMNTDGTGFVKPIKDSISVNKRREKVGLIALEHDVKRHGVKLEY